MVATRWWSVLVVSSLAVFGCDRKDRASADPCAGRSLRRAPRLRARHLRGRRPFRWLDDHPALPDRGDGRRRPHQRVPLRGRRRAADGGARRRLGHPRVSRRPATARPTTRPAAPSCRITSCTNACLQMQGRLFECLDLAACYSEDVLSTGELDFRFELEPDGRVSAVSVKPVHRPRPTPRPRLRPPLAVRSDLPRVERRPHDGHLQRRDLRIDLRAAPQRKSSVALGGATDVVLRVVHGMRSWPERGPLQQELQKRPSALGPVAGPACGDEVVTSATTTGTRHHVIARQRAARQ